ncbi:MAG: DUF2723 domain-containing protein [Cyanobacteria bacterium]|nr:DUF2723 domain-containing protein [Cyanobacteriota bacterium]
MITRRDLAVATLVAIVTLTFFVLTLRPDVGGTEDSPKFQFVGRVLGTSHSPGYPFYAMATWAFGWIPIGNLAYRINLFSAVCGALSCMCIFLTARRLGVTQLLSIAASLAAATSYPVWSNSVTAEVYTLAAVLSGFAVYWLIAFAQTGAVWRLYAACAMWACGFGNHLTIVGILPAALIYGIVKDRSVLKPRVAITAAIIGIAGVLQYAFIAIRTMQGAPYLEARADTVMGVFDVIIARDVSWARFYQAQSTVAAIEVPMLLNGIRVNMGTITIVLVAIAIVMGIKRRHAEVLLIFGAAAGTLAMIANLWGDVVGFITPVCVQLWPLAALGLQWLVAMFAAGALTAAGLLALILPVTNFIANHPRIEALRTPGEGPGVRALYAKLPARSALVAENYWLARLVNYMHFSGEVDPDPNPRVLDSDVNDVKAAVADGLEVYAFEGATHWLASQGLRFERTYVARQPFETWLPDQRRGTLLVAASAGRPLPVEWLPVSGQAQAGRPANYGALAFVVGDAEATIAQQDNLARIDRLAGSEGRTVSVTSSDEGPQITWGDDVLAAIDRGLAVAAFSPAGQLIGTWAFSLEEKPGVQLPPSPYVLRGEVPCQVLRPGQRTSVADVMADGGWWATVEGKGPAAVTIETGEPASTWRHRVSNGRGEASIDAERSRVLFTAVPGTRSVFRLSMPLSATPPAATLEPSDITAVRVCAAPVPALPASGALEVTADHDGWFGAGWHLGERGGTQRFRWSQRASTILWRMSAPSPVRMLLRLRAAHAKGATIQAAINGTALPACVLPAGAWTDCRFEWPETASRAGINRLTLNADTVSPSADRPGDPRELAFVMQASRVRLGR